jgi:hypothetical protein
MFKEGFILENCDPWYNFVLITCRIGTLPYSYSVRADANVLNGTTSYSNLWGYEVLFYNKKMYPVS